MTSQGEYDGDQCIVLPSDYLTSLEAVTEIYEEELSEAATSYEIDSFRSTPGFFHGTLIATLIWAVPVVWTVCV